MSLPRLLDRLSRVLEDGLEPLPHPICGVALEVLDVLPASSLEKSVVRFPVVEAFRIETFDTDITEPVVEHDLSLRATVLALVLLLGGGWNVLYDG